MIISEIHELGLNEFIILSDNTKVMRVPDYWIYIFTNGSSKLVPFSNDFNNKKRKYTITKSKLVEIIAYYFKISNDFYKVKRKEGNRSIAKKVLIKILYDDYKLTFEDIAIYMRYSGHSTCSVSYKKFNDELKYNTDIINDYDTILREFKSIGIKK